MRIGLFTHVYPPMVNGIAVSTRTLENELKRQGHDVFIITNNYNGFSNDFSSEDELKIVSIPIYYQNLRTPIIYNPELFRKIDELQLDVIHSHSDFGIGLLSRIYSFQKDKPHIQTYHCNYIEYAKNNFGKILGTLSTKPVKLYTKYLSSTTNRLIAPSKENFRLLKEDFNIRKDIDLVPNGISLEKYRDVNFEEVKFLKEKYHLKQDDFVLLSLSRLSKEKRVDDIIKMIPYLNGCPKLKLLIVGGGPEEENLKKLTKDLKLNNVIFTGEIENEKIALYYRLATTFITNSVAETQGLTVIEALASSIPVVCINNPLYDDVLIDGKNGFKYKDDAEFIKQIKRLYKNREIIEKVREHTELSVLKYSIEETSKKIVDIYSEEIKKRK